MEDQASDSPRIPIKAEPVPQHQLVDDSCEERLALPGLQVAASSTSNTLKVNRPSMNA